MRKKNLIAIVAIAAIIGISVLIYKYITVPPPPPGDEIVPPEIQESAKPLNITFLLDLSDRITKGVNGSQIECDTAVINYIANKFSDNALQNFTKANDCIQVMFYPTPDDPNITKWADALDVDLSKYKGRKKGTPIKQIMPNFTTIPAKIYESALAKKTWVGSDIWGFFSYKDVDDFCMKPGYRNILIILTDGYLFHKDNKKKIAENGRNLYSYVLDQTLKDPNAGLIAERDGLQDLEVLILETNPTDPKLRPQMEKVISEWLDAMQVGKYKVAHTDLPNATKHIIDNFLGF